MFNEFIFDQVAINVCQVLHTACCINPYWQIMENWYRNFSKIFIFWVVTQAILLENSSSFFRNFNSGASHRPFYWKTYPLKIMDTYSVFFNSGASHRPFDRETNPFEFWLKPYRICKSIDSRDQSSQFGSDLIGWFETVRKCWLLSQIKNSAI